MPSSRQRVPLIRRQLLKSAPTETARRTSWRATFRTPRRSMSTAGQPFLSPAASPPPAFPLAFRSVPHPAPTPWCSSLPMPTSRPRTGTSAGRRSDDCSNRDFLPSFFHRRIRGRKELFMLVMRIVAAACVLLVGRPLFAQEWARYQNRDDRFAVTAPGQPTVEKIKWKSEYDSIFPARVHGW